VTAGGLALERPWLAAATLAIGLAAAILAKRRGAPSVAFGAFPLLDGDVDGRTLRTRLRGVPTILAATALVAAALALGRPVLRVAEPRRAPGVDVVLCLDVSSSMTADLEPGLSRLDAAKAAATAFVAGRPHDRIGLVRFARYPDVACPPTLDHEALLRTIADMRAVPRDDPEDATGLGAAIATAARILGNAPSKATFAALLTDGEENVATAETPKEIAPSAAARLCLERGVRLYAVRAGGDPATRERGAERLKAVAETTGGRFFEARDADGMQATFAAIDGAEKTVFEAPRTRVAGREAPWILLALGAAVLARIAAATWWRVAP